MLRLTISVVAIALLAARDRTATTSPIQGPTQIAVSVLNGRTRTRPAGLSPASPVAVKVVDAALGYLETHGRGMASFRAVQAAHRARRVTAQPVAAHQKHWWKRRETALAAAVLMVLGIWMIWRAGKWTVKLDKYEFENRSEGGVVGFKTYEDSVVHQSKRTLSRYLMGCAFSLVLIAICMLALWKWWS